MEAIVVLCNDRDEGKRVDVCLHRGAQKLYSLYWLRRTHGILKKNYLYYILINLINVYFEIE